MSSLLQNKFWLESKPFSCTKSARTRNFFFQQCGKNPTHNQVSDAELPGLPVVSGGRSEAGPAESRAAAGQEGGLSTRGDQRASAGDTSPNLRLDDSLPLCSFEAREHKLSADGFLCFFLCSEVAGGGDQKPGAQSECYVGDEAPPQADWEPAVYSGVSDGILGKAGEEHLGPLRWKTQQGNVTVYAGLIFRAVARSWLIWWIQFSCNFSTVCKSWGIISIALSPAPRRSSRGSGAARCRGREGALCDRGHTCHESSAGFSGVPEFLDAAGEGKAAGSAGRGEDSARDAGERQQQVILSGRGTRIPCGDATDRIDFTFDANYS